MICIFKRYSLRFFRLHDTFKRIEIIPELKVSEGVHIYISY